MAEHYATIEWQRDGAVFTDDQYPRVHLWRFDGGLTVPASPSPQVVPPPLSDASHVDPEEAFVASIASCHMLFFLSICARRGFVVDNYSDAAIGLLQENNEGRLAITKVVLHPNASYSGAVRPQRNELKKIHQQSHDRCFIANSVRTEVVTEMIA